MSDENLPVPARSLAPSDWLTTKDGELLSPANAAGIRGRTLPRRPRFHPINFAQFCYCSQCLRLVSQVHTMHGPNPLVPHQWKIEVSCHGQAYKMQLGLDVVRAFLAEEIAPAPTLFFHGKEPPIPLTQEEGDNILLWHTLPERLRPKELPPG